METKFTEGPWRQDNAEPWSVDHETASTTVYTGIVSRDGVVALVVSADVHYSDPEHDANARLIAAAPELLAAVTELEDAIADGLCNSGIPDFDPDRLDRAREAARAAIAKALGQ